MQDTSPPHFISLVGAARPAVLFGEQVASSEVFGKAAGGTGKRAGGPPAWAWVDDLSDRLEAARYAVGASDFPSAGVGAPHIRQRTFFGAVRLADADDAGLEGHGRDGDDRHQPRWVGAQSFGSGRACGAAGGLADGNGHRRGSIAGRGVHDAEHHAEPCGGHGGLADSAGERRNRRQDPAGSRGRAGIEADGSDGGLADGACSGRREERADSRGGAFGDCQEGIAAGLGAGSSDLRPGPLHGFWDDADWLFCRDGKWRPVEPGTFPLAHGVSGRVGLLRGYGNAINPHAAAQFIQAFDAAHRHLRLNPLSEKATDMEDIFG